MAARRPHPRPAGHAASLSNRVFAPFISTKGSGGTGLGLAISRHAMLSMGGELVLGEDQGTGACFRLRLRSG